MPWTGEEFRRKHWKAATPDQASQASRIANDILHRTGDEGLAIREAIGVVKKRGKNASK